MNKNKKKWVMFGVGLVITVVAMWYSTRQVELGAFLSQIRNFNYLWLIPAFIIFYYTLYMRAIRWGLLFRPHHDLKGYQVFRPLMICFAFNSILPARVGEVARAVVVGTHNKTGVTTALATVVAERILDSVTLLGMLAICMAVLPPMDPTMQVDVFGTVVTGAAFNKTARGITIFSAMLVAGTIIFMLPLTQRILHAVISALPVGEKWKGKLRHVLIHFAQGFHALQRPWVMVQIVFHSVALWVLIGISNLCVAKGFGLPMSVAQVLAQLVIVAIFIIPAAPGYWGLFEAGTIFSSIVLGITTDQSLALAYALMVHLLQYVPIVIVGLIFAWQLNLRPDAVAEIETVSEAEEKCAS